MQVILAERELEMGWEFTPKVTKAISTDTTFHRQLHGILRGAVVVGVLRRA
jgi:hypothetical protein